MPDRRRYLVNILKKKRNQTTDQKLKEEISRLIEYCDTTTNQINLHELYKCVRLPQHPLHYYGRSVYMAICLLGGDLPKYNLFVRNKLGLDDVKVKKTRNSKKNTKPSKYYNSRKIKQSKLQEPAPPKPPSILFTDVKSKDWTIFRIKYEKITYVNSRGTTITASVHSLKRHINNCNIAKELIVFTIQKYSQPFKKVLASFYYIKYIKKDESLTITRSAINKYGPIWFDGSWCMNDKCVINVTSTWLLLQNAGPQNKETFNFYKALYELFEVWIKYKYNTIHKYIIQQIKKFQNETQNEIQNEIQNESESENQNEIQNEIKNEIKIESESENEITQTNIDLITSEIETTNIKCGDIIMMNGCETNNNEFNDLNGNSCNKSSIMEFERLLMYIKIENIENTNI
eukprot:535014_1